MTQDQQAVAWVYELARSINTETREYCDWGPPQLHFRKPCVPEGSVRNLRPLYATPKSSEGALLAELERLRDRYKSQMKFCDIGPLPYFRDFASQLEVIISKAGKAKS